MIEKVADIFGWFVEVSTHKDISTGLSVSLWATGACPCMMAWHCLVASTSFQALYQSEGQGMLHKLNSAPAKVQSNVSKFGTDKWILFALLSKISQNFSTKANPHTSKHL